MHDTPTTRPQHLRDGRVHRQSRGEHETVRRYSDAPVGGLASIAGSAAVGAASLPVALAGLDDDGFRDASFWPIAVCAGAGASLFTNACVVRAPRQVSSAEVGVVLLLESSGSLAQLVLLLEAAIWTIAGYSSASDFWNPGMVTGISLLLLLIAVHEVAQMKAARRAARRRLCQLLDAAAQRPMQHP
mmetsp:Transcript_25554/g.86121  ORF Transcript_25554/g.86121 Transcript_25554/m.86121 type:complete len:187 (+) Transcript_25554:1026-1586(+)